MATPRYTVFINYRTEDTDLEAHLLYKRLAARFGESKTFMAKESIEGGDDYRARIMDALRDSSVVVALIGDRWATCVNESGTRRLDEPDDWVRVELETAMASEIPIVPTEVNGGTTPSVDVLPSSIGELAYRQAFPLSNKDFDGDADRLATRILELARPETASAAVTVPDGWTAWERTSDLGCTVKFALPSAFRRAYQNEQKSWVHRVDQRVGRSSPRKVQIEVYGGTPDLVVEQLCKHPRFVEREDVELPVGIATRVRHSKKWGEDGEWRRLVVDAFVIPVKCGSATSVVAFCTTAPRRIAEHSALFLAIVRTISVSDTR
jgi:hypothetical protein